MNLEKILKEKFGFTQFKIGQKEVIQDVIAKKDTIAILPTGSGKSLCYQLPAYVCSGTVLIITPLVSLMEDQVAIMKKNGEKRVVALNSFLSYQDRQRIIHQLEQYKFIFVSPEMLLQNNIARKLKQLNIAFIVVDEAHCISQWGFDFRPDYLRIGEFFKGMNRSNILALTATAGKKVIQDIMSYLNLTDVQTHKYSIDRPNLTYLIKQIENDIEKTKWIKERVSKTVGPGIIYVGSRRRTESLALILEQAGCRVAFYHGGMPQEDRTFIQEQFLNEEIDWICATNAFGMGVHKNNIRQVIHEHIPATVANYVQEVGRAGRDGKESIATLLYSTDDIRKTRFIIQEDFPSEEAIKHFHNLLEQGGNIKDVSHILTLSETNIRVLQYYFERYSIEETICRIEEQFLEKEKQLQSIVSIIQSGRCIREEILMFFEELPVLKEGNCCSVCGEIDLPWLYEVTRQNLLPRELFEWDERLTQLLG